MKHTDKQWIYNRADYTIEQLIESMPVESARKIKLKARTENREVTRSECDYVYKHVDGTVNLNAIESVLRNIRNDPDYNDIERHRVESELRMSSAGATQSESRYIDQFNRDISMLRSTRTQSRMGYTRPQAPAQVSLGMDIPTEFNTQIDGSNLTSHQLLQMAAAVGPALQIPGVELKAVSEYVRKADYKKGAVGADYRALPNFRALGINRPAGEAIPEEMKIAVGQSKMDGTAPTTKDFFSVGALLGNNDIIPHMGVYIPPIELARMAAILKIRSKKSDTNHSRKVEDCHFTVINPDIGEDAATKLSVDHPYLGTENYTALIARLIFPLMEINKTQQAAVESVRRGTMEKVSMAFAHSGFACALCGEMPIKNLQSVEGMTTGILCEKSSNKELFSLKEDEDSFYGACQAILRTPASVEGGFVYNTVRILRASNNGLLQIEPVPNETLMLNDKSVVMMKMNSFWYWTYCRLHNLLGMRLRDGRVNIGKVTDVRYMINLAGVDAGAIFDAMIVLDPDRKY